MLTSRHQLYAIALGLGVANALLRPVLVAAREQGVSAVADGFGVSFVIWLSLAWGFYTLWRTPGQFADSHDFAAAGVVTCGLLVPVATASWLVTGTAALYWLGKTKPNVRAASACAVIAFAALRDPIASLVLRLLAGPLLDFDATLVASVLGWANDGIARAGNLIYAADGHQLLIMTGCTSYTNMSIALLGWFTISKVMAGEYGRISWPTGLLVALAIFAINIGRLAVMGLGPDAYTFMHDGLGALISEMLMLTSTIFISLLGNRHGTPAQLLPHRA